MPEDLLGGTPTPDAGAEGNGQSQEAAKTPENAGGKPAQTQDKPAAIDWTKIDPASIPAEVLKRNPEFGKVLDESIQRRKENARLKKALSEDGEPGGDADTQKPPTQEDLLKQVIARLDKFDADAREKTEKERRVAIAKAAGLPEDWGIRLIGSTDAELLADAQEVAKSLPQQKKFGGETSPANFGNPDQMEALTQRTKENLSKSFDIDKASGVFSPGVQRQKGGGPLR